MQKNIKTLSNFDLNENILNLAKSERKITHQILLYINEIELRKLYLSEGFNSMFDYLVKKVGYCESAAYRRLSSARLLQELPEISSRIELGILNLSQLSQVQTALKQEKKELKNKFGSSQFSLRDKALDVICKLENQNQKQSTIIIAKEFNLPITTEEKAKLQKDLSLKLELVFNEDEAKLLNKVKALTSHQNPEQGWKELVLLLAKKELKKWEVKSAGKNKIYSSECSSENLKGNSEYSGKDIKNDSEYSVKNNEAITNFQQQAAPLEKSAVIIARKHLSIRLKRELFSRANFQCQHVDPKSQQRCVGTHFLQIDHKVPLAKGGTNEFQNLRVLCQTHNLQAAKDWGLS